MHEKSDKRRLDPESIASLRDMASHFRTAYRTVTLEEIIREGEIWEQRKIKDWWVNILVKDWCILLYNDIILVRSPKQKKYFVVDGGHRVTALDTMGEESCTAKVLIPTDKKGEAAIEKLCCLKYVSDSQARLPQTAVTIFNKKLNGDDPRCWAIAETLADIDMVVGANDDELKCVATIEWIFNHYGSKVLQEVFYVSREMWKELKSFKPVISKALAIVIHTAMSVKLYSRKRLIKKIGHNSPREWIAHVKTVTGQRQCRMPPTARVLASAYNKDFRDSKKIDVLL